jgi:hypothetical protein
VPRAARFLVGSLVATTACSLGPPLCLRTPEERALPRAVFAVGAEFQFAAGQLDILDECDREPPPDVRWTSSVPAVATIDARGRVRAVAPGRTEVIVRAALAEARHGIVVVPPIARVRLLPADTTFRVGDTVALRAVAIGTDGRPLPQARVAFRVTWSGAGREEGARAPIRVAYPSGREVPPPAPNTLRVYADHAGSAHVVASAVGRTDSVPVRSVRP